MQWLVCLCVCVEYVRVTRQCLLVLGPVIFNPSPEARISSTLSHRPVLSLVEHLDMRALINTGMVILSATEGEGGGGSQGADFSIRVDEEVGSGEDGSRCRRCGRYRVSVGEAVVVKDKGCTVRQKRERGCAVNWIVSGSMCVSYEGQNVAWDPQWVKPRNGERLYRQETAILSTVITAVCVYVHTIWKKLDFSQVCSLFF